MLAGLAEGTVDLVVSAAALIRRGVAFPVLGVAVVISTSSTASAWSNAALRAANRATTVPDLLVMTATPSRTAAMTVCREDLDVTVLDELPAGRRPVLATIAQRRRGRLRLGAREVEVEAGRHVRGLPADRGFRAGGGFLGGGDLRGAGRR
ncbi:MAG: hypothetical protein R2716_06320 [Microthrixaceae bacterium]